MPESVNEKSVPQRKFIGSDRKQAAAEAETIVALGGLAWVESEYGTDMGRENVFWGWRVMFFSPEVVRAAANKGGST